MTDTESQQSETVKSTYQAWLDEEEIPVVHGYSVDIRTVATGPWRRRGGLGAYINLEGAQESLSHNGSDVLPYCAAKPL